MHDIMKHNVYMLNHQLLLFAASTSTTDLHKSIIPMENIIFIITVTTMITFSIPIDVKSNLKHQL